MEDAAGDSAATAATAALANELSHWLRRAGIERTELAVDFADLVHGAKVVEASLHRLLALDLEQSAEAELAMEELGRMHAWLFTDMLPHLKELEEGWQALEDQVVRRLPPEPDDG